MTKRMVPDYTDNTAQTEKFITILTSWDTTSMEGSEKAILQYTLKMTISPKAPVMVTAITVLRISENSHTTIRTTGKDGARPEIVDILTTLTKLQTEVIGLFHLR